MNNGNGNDSARVYLDAVQAQLGERVTNLGRRQTDLESEMRTGFRTIEQSIASLSSNLADRNKPQWQALSVMLAFAAILGGLAYMPIREATSDLKLSVTALASATVTRQEMDWRQARGQEDRLRMESSINQVRTDQVPRAELDRTFVAYDQRFSDLQRQIDDSNTRFGSTYTLGDYISRLTERLDTLEERTLSLRSSQP